MRYLVIHSIGYGGQGPWVVDFEIEAKAPDAPVTGVFPCLDGDKVWLSDVTGLLDHEPELNAGDVATRTGGQFIGLLAEKDTGMVVFSGNHLSKVEQYHWTELNEDPFQLAQRKARAEYAKQYRKRMTEEQKQRAREKARERQRAWREAHPEEAARKSKKSAEARTERYRNDPEFRAKYREQQREYAQNRRKGEEQ